MDSMLGFLLAGSVVLLLLASVLVVAFYVLFAIGTMKVLKARGHAYPWMAWVPVLNYFALGQTCDEGDGNVTLIGLRIPTLVFSLWFVLFLVVGYIPNVGSLLQTIVQVLFFGRTCQCVYAKMEGKPENETAVIGYLSGLLPIIAMVKFLCYKSNK